MTARQAAEYLGVTIDRVYKICLSGRVKADRLVKGGSSQWKLDDQSVFAYKESRRPKHDPEGLTKKIAFALTPDTYHKLSRLAAFHRHSVSEQIRTAIELYLEEVEVVL